MGAQRIQEVTMFALLFLLIGVIFLLVAAGRIWIDATPVDSPTIDLAVVHDTTKSRALNHISKNKDSGS